MRSLEKTFEAHILVNGIKRMFHFRNLKNQDQAQVRARKVANRIGGKILSVRKVNVDDWPSGIELMRLEAQPRGLYLGAGVYDRDIDLDKILGLTKDTKRRKGDKKET